MVETELYTMLTGATLINASTNLGSRVYPVIAPQNPTYPHLIYTRISGGQVNGLSGYLNAENPRMQIDIYSTSYSKTKTLADNVHTVLDGATTFKAILVSDNDLHEEEIKAFRVSMDFSLYNTE